VKTSVGQWFPAYLESIDTGVVLGDIELVTRRHLAHGLLRMDAAEAIPPQFFGHIPDSQEVNGRSVKKGQ